jgi:hypothetical protein
LKIADETIVSNAVVAFDECKRFLDSLQDRLRLALPGADPQPIDMSARREAQRQSVGKVWTIRAPLLNVLHATAWI